jgi:cytochrome P450
MAMGQDINTVDRDENSLQRDVQHLFNIITKRLTSPFPYWRYIKLPHDRAADACADRVQQAVLGFIEQARKKLEADPALRVRPTNMLEALIIARDELGSEFNDSHVVGNAITMVFAGEDTTSKTLAWLMYFMGKYPEKARLIAEEADRSLGSGTLPPDFADLNRFGYLDAAISETMRMKMVAPFVSLEANEDIVLGETLVPQGTLILSLLRFAGLSENNFPRPDEFVPERWVPGHPEFIDEEIKGKSFPFGGGGRLCPGRYLAVTQIRTVISMVTKNFIVELVDGAPPVQELFRFMMSPSALPLRLRKRNASGNKIMSL